MTRETALIQTFVEIADTLVDDFDVVDLLTVLADRCVEVLDVDAAGLMIASADGELRVLGSSSNAMRLLELFEVQAQQGPCFEAYTTGAAVYGELGDSADDRWNEFASRAIEAGFRSVQALPMRLRGHTIGALNLFRHTSGPLDGPDLAAAQAFADVATIALRQQRAAAEATEVNQQLTNALNSRVAIEQAKGMVAERLVIDMENSFGCLRAYARNNNLRLVDVARDVIDGSLASTELRSKA